MLTITHTMTALDAEALGRVFSRLAKASSNSKVRRPFRLGLFFLGFAMGAIGGFALLESETLLGLLFLAIGLLGIFQQVWVRLFHYRIRRASRKVIGQTVKWEIENRGLSTNGELQPWSTFKAFEFAEDGVVLVGSVNKWFPNSVIADPTINTELRKILERNIGSPAPPPPIQ